MSKFSSEETMRNFNIIFSKDMISSIIALNPQEAKTERPDEFNSNNVLRRSDYGVTNYVISFYFTPPKDYGPQTILMFEFIFINNSFKLQSIGDAG